MDECTLTFVLSASLSLIIGFAFGKDSGFKRGLKEGIKRQLHKEAYDGAPFENKHDEPILEQARNELAKELKPKPIKMHEGKKEVWVSFEWSAVIIISIVVAWLFLN